MSVRVKHLREWLGNLPVENDEDFVYLECYTRKLGEQSPMTGMQIYGWTQARPSRVVLRDSEGELMHTENP